MTTTEGAAGADEQQVRDARLVLGWLVEPGSKQLYELVRAHGPVEALARLTAGAATGALAEAAAVRLNGRDPARLAQALWERGARLGVRIVTPESAQWPEQLDDLRHISVEGRDTIDRDTYPPQCLWVRGPHDLREAGARAVSLVGSRSSTVYGAHVGAELGYGLADRGWTVVSGGAYGIDAVVHRAALAAGGLTVSVLACGVDRPYPLSNSALFEQIAEEGLLVSEWPPGTAPFKVRFLVRNRVIAALSRGTVLVEAAARSGARQTLRRARQLGRAAMAVPGPVTSENSVGCHEELRREPHEPVRAVASVGHVLEEVGGVGDLAPVPRGREQALDALDPVERQLVDAVPRRGAAAAGQIAYEAGVPLREALAKLPSLALRGHVREQAGGFVRARNGAGS
ncbi:putative DNA processing protein DprA [Catellatospora sp. TT07R-123]|uniref:DNA-processing protein DprA n=1 Tax=Catellatospora sp. TT07R-123 TaxID=2733863 RepID=UPI001B1F981F|nr:DNA-processing protein DprA [Catellatospora sp. TT07R-123]GHJ49799.1 putative DNA processing protein DprA [Catellatospora sp. TT07R-123]